MNEYNRDSSKHFPTFVEWVKIKIKEMGGASIGLAGIDKSACHDPNFQVQGALCQESKPRRKKKKKKH